MSNFEYKAIPSPRRAEKRAGVKGEEQRFAVTLTEVLNEQSLGGWEYYRTEQIPADVKRGLFGRRSEELQTLLIFRRVKSGVVAEAPREPMTATSEPKAAAPKLQRD
ncbi:hypothetical protein ACMA5I_06255 [Paracoccaceae bacterium GXU_MW_L88]